MGIDFSIAVQIFHLYDMLFSVLRRILIHKNRIGFPSTRNPAFKSFPHFLPKALKDTSARPSLDIPTTAAPQVSPIDGWFVEEGAGGGKKMGTRNSSGLE